MTTKSILAHHTKITRIIWMDGKIIRGVRCSDPSCVIVLSSIKRQTVIGQFQAAER